MATYETYQSLEVLKHVFVDGSDAVVDECLTEQHCQHTYPHVVVVVALQRVTSTQCHIIGQYIDRPIINIISIKMPFVQIYRSRQ